MHTLKKADMIIGIGLLILSILVWVGAGQYAGRGASEYGPELFPQFLAAAMFLCALLLVFQAVRGRAMVPEGRIDPQGMLRAGISIGICVVYVILMQLIGFLIATAGFLFAMMTFIGQKGLVTRIIVSIAVTVGVMLLFQSFLKIPLPEMDFSFRY